MGRIQVLTDRVANQIAAGEVVERPASVCKELIENALDAGATRLRIELKGGGRNLIEVSDNGGGMGRDDAMLAFERHATSKLREASDLIGIATLGFRGEALPSIASVSRVLMRTRPSGDETGTVVEIHGGRLRDVRDEALAPGTTVSVRSLFYNVPARRKFLRTEKTELAHATRIATHYSLAHLDKSIELRNEHGSLLAVTPVATLRERVYQVFGADTLDRLVELQEAERPVEPADGGGAMRLAGFVSEPQSQRSNRNSIYIFINRRLVRDSLIQRALTEAYENLMPRDVYPFALLTLEIPPALVDVNVHPAKTEVRFRAPSAVFQIVRDTVRAQLIASKPGAELPIPTQPAQSVPMPAPAPRTGAGLPVPRVGPAEAGRSQPRSSGSFGLPPGAPRASVHPEESGPPGVDGLRETFGTESAGHARAPLDERRPDSLVDLSGLQLLGQIHDSFIVAAGTDGLWIIDQHVAHERILFEKVLADRLHGRAAMQRLLVPIVVTLTPGQAVAYDDLAEELAGNGFEIERLDGRAVAVQSSPAELSASQVEALLQDLLDDSRERDTGLGLADLRKRMAATIACHAAIKINTPLATEKMTWLLDELARSECPMSCPHGRPIALKYATREILKAFHRV